MLDPDYGFYLAKLSSCLVVYNKLLVQKRIYSNVLQLLFIFSLAVVFGALGFLYSFTGFFDHKRETIPVSLDPFEAFTIEEIGGHFLFGFVIGIPFRSLKISVLTGLMALTIDTDHFLNYAGFHTQGRIDHSIPFVILSSILMSAIATKIFYKLTNANQINILPFLSGQGAATKSELHYINKVSIEDNRLYMLFSMITIAAFLSHISYDVFVDNNAKFPLLAPFSYSQFVIHRTYGLPIEGSGLILIYMIYRLYLENRRT